ncbi:unnamed protein product [Paramecium sonneborni]|uniref:Uncharacterized protein n=1 Tax=Paramecium sonneborni TaxID=65129 RepID=A0A8S1MYK6_9CILI|nr:unnamed protein product [Paramecium sonneborni]
MQIKEITLKQQDLIREAQINILARYSVTRTKIRMIKIQLEVKIPKRTKKVIFMNYMGYQEQKHFINILNEDPI